MSKIGKKPITIPSGVEVSFSGSLMSAKGPKGQMSKELPGDLNVKMADSQLLLSPKLMSRESKTLWGLSSSIAKNLIKGVSEGFEKVLEFQGVGYKAVVKGDSLELSLGFSHPISYKAPEGISFKVEKNMITVQGIDKELVGKVAAEIRSFREPEPYKGSGIRYKGEIIIKKAGKKAVATG